MIRIVGKDGFSEERVGICAHITALAERFPGTKIIISVEANVIHSYPVDLRQQLSPQFKPGTLIFLSGWKSDKTDHLGVITQNEEKVSSGNLLYEVITGGKFRIWKDLFSVASQLESRHEIRDLLSKQLRGLRWETDKSGCRTVTGKSPGNQDDMGIAIMLGLLWTILVVYNPTHAHSLGLSFPRNSVPLTHEAKLAAIYSVYYISEKVPNQIANVSTMGRKRIRLDPEFPTARP